MTEKAKITTIAIEDAHLERIDAHLKKIAGSRSSFLVNCALKEIGRYERTENDN